MWQILKKLGENKPQLSIIIQELIQRNIMMRLLLILLLTINLLNAKKIALLIGNNDYAFQPLANPLHDVDGIYKTLREIGFKESNIKVLKNASQSQMQKALANFSQRARSAEIAFVYFSGHGMQVNNRNYMFPARTTATKPVDLYGLVDLDYFIQSASSAKYGIVLVDACRNNPLVKYFQNGKHKGATAKKGLGQVTPTTGQVVIGFATSAGDTADDGNGDMSPYAKALSVRLKEPNKDITKVLGLVALDVSKKYSQNPIIRTNLAYDVILSKSDDKVSQPSTPKVVVKVDSKPTTVVTFSSKWIVPTKSICENNNGKYSKYYPNTCTSNWINAKKICKEMGGALASKKDFRQLILDCGGIPIAGTNRRDSIKNRDNSSYQSCIKKKGFISNAYWTTTTRNPVALGIHFQYGEYTWAYKDENSYYVHCVKVK